MQPEPAPACAPINPLFMGTYYFCFFAILGSYLPFMSLFFEQSLGFSGNQIGQVFSARQLMIALAPPIWGIISDRFNSARRLMFLGLLFSALTLVMFDHLNIFWQVFALMLVFSFFNAPLFPLADSITFGYFAECPGSYGAVRALGSLGFVFINIILMALIAYTGRIAVTFYVGALFSVITLLLLPRLPYVRIRARGVVGARAFKLFLQKDLLIFTICGVLGMAAMMAYFTFFPNYLFRMGYETRWIGLLSAVAAVSETPVIFYAERLISKFGIKVIYGAGIGAVAVRLIILALAPGTTVIVLTQVLHSLTFGALLIGGLIYVNTRCPSDLRASAQSIFSSAVLGLGGVLGSLFSGWLFDLTNVFTMFAVNAGVAALTLTAFIALFNAAGESLEEELLT